MRRLLVIGSMDEFVELARHARRRGCYVIVADGYVDGPARAYADEDHVVDVRDPRKLAELYKSCRADAVVTSYSDVLFESACEMRRILGADEPFPLESMEILRDKASMRKLLDELGVAHPRSVEVSSSSEALESSRGLAFPCVMKPVDGYGSHGIRVVRDSAEAARVFGDVARHATRGERCLIEEYDEGAEINMTAWVCDGVAYPVSFADREKTFMGEGIVPQVTRIVYPSRQPRAVFDRALEIVQAVVDRLGVTAGPVCMQFFCGEGSRVSVCEITGRVFGYEHELIELGSGLSVEELLLDTAFDKASLKRRLEAHVLSAFVEPCCGLYFHGCDGVVGDLSRARESLRDDAVVDSLFYVEEGDAFTHGEGSKPYIARAYLQARDYRSLDRASARVLGAFYVPDAEGGDLSLVGRLPAYAAHELVSVVIPCYYSKNMIGKVVRLTRDELVALGYDTQFVLVNDGSDDGTYDAICALSDESDDVVGIDLMRNFGQHNAIMAGLHQVAGDIVMVMDDDMQTHPSQCRFLLERLSEGADVVFGKYRVHKESAFRRAGSSFAMSLIRLLADCPKGIVDSNYFVMRRIVCDEMISYRSPSVYIQGLIFRTTNRIENVDIDHFEREEGSSGYTLKSLMKLTSTILNFSAIPLRIATVLGCVLGILGLAGAIALLVERLIDPEMVIGWSSLMVTVLVCSGVITICIGIVGEYVGRLFQTDMGRPQFIVRKKKGGRS